MKKSVAAERDGAQTSVKTSSANEGRPQSISNEKESDFDHALSKRNRLDDSVNVGSGRSTSDRNMVESLVESRQVIDGVCAYSDVRDGYEMKLGNEE